MLRMMLFIEYLVWYYFMNGGKYEVLAGQAKQVSQKINSCG